MKKIYSVLLLLFPVATTFGQKTQNAFYVGHSLSDQIAEMVMSMSQSHSTVDFDFAYQSIPGAPLRWNWDHGATFTPIPPHFYGYNHPTEGLPKGVFTTLVLTEAVPRTMSLIDETYAYSELFYDYASDYNPNISVFINEVWHCINSGTPTGCDDDEDANPWRQRLTDDLPMWESVVDNLNSTFNPENPVCLIPGGQGMARLHDEIELGTVPGLTSINELFVDDIHLSDVGKYFIACIHFAMLFNETPVGLPNQLYSIWGDPFTAPSAALAQRFQEIAWETVTQYPNSCYHSMGLPEPKKLAVSMYPNPSENTLNIHSAQEVAALEIYDFQGRKIEAFRPETNNIQLNTAHYNSGIYLIRIHSNGQTATKKFLKK